MDELSKKSITKCDKKDLIAITILPNPKLLIQGSDSYFRIHKAKDDI